MNTEIPIISLDVQNEMDVMLAHRRAMQFARFAGIRLSEQTRFATAVSEICRNIIEYAEKGVIQFKITDDKNIRMLSATLSDKGKGIKNLSTILERQPGNFKGRGLGIVYAQRLSDDFDITSSSSGTTVIVKKYVPAGDLPLNKLIVQGWVKHLSNEPVISAYEELKMRNIQLVELTEELIQNSKTVEIQIEEIRKLNDRLLTSNSRMKEFTYALSHDLKTPLSSLKLSSEYLDQNPNADDAPTYKQIHLRSIARINKTISSLIEILDFQNTHKQIVKELVFEDIFNEAREEYEQFIAESRAVIKTDFTATSSITYIEAYLQSIFHNLLSNSLRYRNPKRSLKINAHTKKTGKFITLVFSDTGAGMDMAKIKERLFVPFNRFSDEPGGKGIGLYLIKGMVESNGGSVIVESSLKKGTTFTFKLVPFQQTVT